MNRSMPGLLVHHQLPFISSLNSTLYSDIEPLNQFYMTWSGVYPLLL